MKAFLSLLGGIFIYSCLILNISSCSDDPLPNVEVSFTVDKEQITQNEYIQYSDSSKGNPTSWEWSFEGGTPQTSSEQNPKIKYSEPGVYKAILIASNADKTGSLTKTDYIIVLPEEGMMAYYPLDGNANDLSDNHNDGTSNRFIATDNRHGDSSSALIFDGLSDYVMIDHKNEIDFNSEEDFTISIWIKPDEQLDLDGDNNEILGKWYANPTYPYSYAIRFWNSTSELNKGLIYARQWYTTYCDQNESNRLYSSVELDKNEWYHVIFEKMGQDLIMYINNEIQGTIHLSIEDGCDTSTAAPLFLAKRFDSTRYFKGSLDDFRIFNYSLTEGAIKALFFEM